MAKKGLEKLAHDKGTYDEDSRTYIDSLIVEEKHIAEINSMKRTPGWKILDKKIREELRQRIRDLIKDDMKIQTLMQLLVVTDTKSMEKNLDQEIEAILPDG